MASPNTLARNAAHAHLVVSAIPVGPEPQQKWALPGEYKELLAQSIRIHNRKRADEHRSRQLGRAIPTSGPGRRRAKALRDKAAAVETQTAEA